MKALPVNGYILVTPVEDASPTERRTAGLILHEGPKPTTKLFKVAAAAQVEDRAVPEGAVLIVRGDAAQLTASVEGRTITFIHARDTIGVLN
jgi:hypothetical protein